MIDNLVIKAYKKINIFQKCAFWGSLTGGLFAHMYMFANKFPNHDDLRYGFDLHLKSTINNIYDMSRWALPTVSDFSGHWSCPWLIGALSLILIGTAAGIIVRVMDIQSLLTAFLIGVLMAVFPTVTGTFTYMMTADGYFYSLLLACTAAFALTSDICVSKLRIALGSILVSLSLGLYQGYLPVCCCLIIMFLVKQYTLKEYNGHDVFRCLLESGISIALGIMIYFMLARIFQFSGDRFSGQNGIPLNHLPHRFFEAVLNLAGFFCGNRYGVSTPFNAFVFLEVLISSIMAFLIILKKESRQAKEYMVVAMLVVLYALSLILIYFLTSEYIHILMVYSFAMLPIGCLALADWIGRKEWSTILGKALSSAICIGAGLLCWNYIVTANHTYLKMDIMDSQVYGYSVRLVERIENMEGYTSEMPIVFIGAPSIENGNAEFSGELWKDEQITGVLTPDQMFGLAATAYNSYEDYLRQRLGWDHIVYREFGHFGGNINGLDNVKASLRTYPEAGSMAVCDGFLFVRFE